MLNECTLFDPNGPYPGKGAFRAKASCETKDAFDPNSTIRPSTLAVLAKRRYIRKRRYLRVKPTHVDFESQIETRWFAMFELQPRKL
jgi:hypothetical protein